MSRPRLLALAAWLATVLAVTAICALGLAAADLGTLVTLVLNALGLLVGLLAGGAVLLVAQPHLTGAVEDRSGCGACGQSCLKAGSGSVASRECSSTS